MGINNKIFNDAKISRVLLKFAVPAVISLLVLELYNMVDTVFVGRYIGPNAIAALTVAFPVQRFLTAVGMLISIGASTYVARNLGEKNTEALRSTIINAFVLSVITLLTVSLGIIIFKNSIITALGASSIIFPMADIYISIVLISAVFQGTATVACYIMTALGNTKNILYANLLGSICNVVINYILITLLGFGIHGAAIATVISQIVTFAFAMYKFRVIKINFNLKFTVQNIVKVFNIRLLTGIAAVGFSTFMIEISDAVVAVILNNLLVAEGGEAALVIVGVITKISMFMFITIIGISASMQPIVAYNFGAKRYNKMKETLKISIAAVTIATLSFWGIFMIFAEPIIGFFITDTQILNEAVRSFRICISLLPAIGLYYICIYYYQAIEQAKKSFILSIYRQIVIFIPLAVLFIHLFGVVGAWVAYPVSDVISSLTSIHFIRKASREAYGEKSDNTAEKVIVQRAHA
jgi:putative MATE family efflux protein